MKKSASLPNLSSRSVPLVHKSCSQSALVSPESGARSSTIVAECLSMASVMTVIGHEVQLEAIMHSPAIHAGLCSLSHQELPTDILDSHSYKDVATCMAEPSLESDPPTLPRPPSTSFLEMCEIDPRVSERFSTLLRRVRRARKDASASASMASVSLDDG